MVSTLTLNSPNERTYLTSPILPDSHAECKIVS